MATAEFKLTERHRKVLARIEAKGPLRRQAEATEAGAMGGGLYLLDRQGRQASSASINAGSYRARLSDAAARRAFRRLDLSVVRGA